MIAPPPFSLFSSIWLVEMLLLVFGEVVLLVVLLVVLFGKVLVVAPSPIPAKHLHLVTRFFELVHFLLETTNKNSLHLFKNSVRNVSSSCQYRLGNVEFVVGIVGVGIVGIGVGIGNVGGIGIIGNGGVIIGMGIVDGGIMGSGIIVPSTIVVMGGIIGIGINVPMGDCDCDDDGIGGIGMIGKGNSWSGVVVVVIAVLLVLNLVSSLSGTFFGSRVELTLSIIVL